MPAKHRRSRCVPRQADPHAHLPRVVGALRAGVPPAPGAANLRDAAITRWARRTVRRLIDRHGSLPLDGGRAPYSSPIALGMMAKRHILDNPDKLAALDAQKNTVFLLIAVAVLAFAGFAFAGSGSDPAATLCAKKADGALRLARDGKCKRTETRLRVNQVVTVGGPAGPIGPAGPKGSPGATPRGRTRPRPTSTANRRHPFSPRPRREVGAAPSANSAPEATRGAGATTAMRTSRLGSGRTEAGWRT